MTAQARTPPAHGRRGRGRGSRGPAERSTSRGRRFSRACRTVDEPGPEILAGLPKGRRAGTGGSRGPAERSTDPPPSRSCEPTGCAGPRRPYTHHMRTPRSACRARPSGARAFVRRRGRAPPGRTSGPRPPADRGPWSPGQSSYSRKPGLRLRDERQGAEIRAQTVELLAELDAHAVETLGKVVELGQQGLELVG
jgi:hypothetical protein